MPTGRRHIEPQNNRKGSMQGKRLDINSNDKEIINSTSSVRLLVLLEAYMLIKTPCPPSTVGVETSSNDRQLIRYKLSYASRAERRKAIHPQSHSSGCKFIWKGNHWIAIVAQHCLQTFHPHKLCALFVVVVDFPSHSPLQSCVVIVCRFVFMWGFHFISLADDATYWTPTQTRKEQHLLYHQAHIFRSHLALEEKFRRWLSLFSREKMEKIDRYTTCAKKFSCENKTLKLCGFIQKAFNISA